MGWRYTGLQTGAECGKERGMAFDFKKEYREFYLPKDRPEIVAEIGRASCRERV